MPFWQDEELRRTSQRIERKLDVIMRAMALEYIHERETEMATAETLARLQAELTENTDATASVKTALETYAAANADLTQQLKDAIAASADEDALKAIADQLDANNNALTAAAGATAKAATDNTPAASA